MDSVFKVQIGHVYESNATEKTFCEIEKAVGPFYPSVPCVLDQGRPAFQHLWATHERDCDR